MFETNLNGIVVFNFNILGLFFMMKERTLNHQCSNQRDIWEIRLLVSTIILPKRLASGEGKIGFQFLLWLIDALLST